MNVIEARPGVYMNGGIAIGPSIGVQLAGRTVNSGVDDDGEMLFAAMGEEPTENDAWQAGVNYVVDDVVTYNGATYRCLQAHVSQAGGYPTDVPALWQLV